MERGDCGGHDPGRGAGGDSEVILDVSEEDAKVLEDAGAEARDEER